MDAGERKHSALVFQRSSDVMKRLRGSTRGFGRTQIPGGESSGHRPRPLSALVTPPPQTYLRLSGETILTESTPQ
ncbi:uncharacterized protein V6R79_023655 [Siganus canaliculatus]